MDIKTVGIGTDTPSVNLLMVKGSASNGQTISWRNWCSWSQIYADNDGVLILNAGQGNSAANFWTYLSFNVVQLGIATAVPSYRLDIGNAILKTLRMVHSTKKIQTAAGDYIRMYAGAGTAQWDSLWYR